MILEPAQWESFRSFLLFEKKFSDKAQSMYTYKARFKTLATYFNGRDWNRTLFNQFIASNKANGVSDSTLNKHISLAKLVDSFLGTTELQSYSYFRECQTFNKETLTPEEIEKLAKVKIFYQKRRKFINRRQRVLILFLGMTGARISEALELTWENVFTDHVKFIDTKSAENRDVPINNEMYQMLMKLTSGPKSVFLSGRGGILGSQEVNLDLKRRCKAVGLTKNVSCHTFRHSFITECLSQGMDWFTLSFICGHKNPETTRRYSHHLLSFFKDQLFSHHPMLRKSMNRKMVVEKLKKTISEIDASRFPVKMEEDKGWLCVRVKL